MITYSIMASEERRHLFPYIQSVLPDVPFAVDSPRHSSMNIGVWENCKKAWRLHGKEKFHCVIQDDAIFTDNFKEKVLRMLKDNPDKKVFNLFYMGEPNKDRYEGDYLVENFLLNGVGVILETSLIEEMIAHGDTLEVKEDDTKIADYVNKKGLKVVYPMPPFLQHRTQEDTPSLVGNKNTRISTNFI